MDPILDQRHAIMDRPDELEAIVRWLARPASYRHSPHRVEHVETHISDVFLAGPFVYKLKKPVRYDSRATLDSSRSAHTVRGAKIKTSP